MLTLCLLSSNINFPKPSTSEKLNLPINTTINCLCYYSISKNGNRIIVQEFNPLIFKLSNINAKLILQFKKGHDRILDTTDNVLAIGYFSLGENSRIDETEISTRPYLYGYNTSREIFKNKDYPSEYIDVKNRNGSADKNSNKEGYYLNADDSFSSNDLNTNSARINNSFVHEDCNDLRDYFYFDSTHNDSYNPTISSVINLSLKNDKQYFA